MTRKALDMLKSIAMGEYKSVEEVVVEETNEETAAVESEQEKPAE